MTRFSMYGKARTATVGLVAAITLAACGGGGGGGSSGGGGGGGNGGGGGGGSNSAPVADAGPDLNVLSADFVQLSGSATDPDTNDTLNYAWSQTGGPAVSLANANSAVATFTAPATAVPAPGGASVMLSGKLLYEFVPPQPLCRGLNMNMPEERPIRAATVQVLDQSAPTVLRFRLTVNDAAGAVSVDDVEVQVVGLLGSTVADDNGDYQLSVPADSDVSVRVRAELLQDSGNPGWDVAVRDNTLQTEAALADRPLYVLDGSAFNTGNSNVTRSLTAATGWDGLAYTAPRAAAPFAVLDAIYSAMQLVRGVDASADFAPLDVYWSINNTTAQGSGSDAENIASGEIGTSYYSSNALFLLGKADDDTEEFDDHVIVHEWGHYFEDNFSRSDSIGGSHGFGDRLDMRVAFGEGWATALSGIALEEPIYCDTQGQGQANGFEIDIESDSPAPRGWFNEFSVMAMIYDLWDDTVEVGRGDSGSLGFGPIYDTMVNRQMVTPAYTSIFSFAAELQNEAPASSLLVADLFAHHNIDGSGIYGDGETNDGNSATPADALPVYTEIPTDGTPVNICSNRENDPSGFEGNRLSEYRFLRMSIGTAGRYRFEVITDAATVAQLPPDDPDDDIDQSDPDLLFYLNGKIQNVLVGNPPAPQGLSGVANQEVFTTPNSLPVGNYVLDVVEFRHADEDTDRGAFPARSCFDITIQPAP